MTKTNKQKTWQVILFLSLLLNGFSLFYFTKKVISKNRNSSQVAPPRPAYYLDRDKLFQVLPSDSGSIVFLGNSLTQYYELAELFKNDKIKNRGIHGDDIEGVLKRLEPIIRSQPKKIFIELGTNDLDVGRSQENILTSYSRLIDTLQRTCPTAKIYIQSILPTANSSALLPSYCSPQRNKEIKEVNAALNKIAVTKSCTYIDVHRFFAVNEQLNPAYSVDGVHLSGEGYLRWTQILKPFVDE